MKRMLEPLPRGEPFPFNYTNPRIDRNALFALNQVFPPDLIASVRTKYHRSNLNFDDLHSDLKEYDCPKPPRRHTSAYYLVLESVRRDLGLEPGSVIPLTTGAVVKHPDLPGSKSPGLPEKLEGYNTKREALSDPKIVDRIRRLWYSIECGQAVELPDVACYARSQIVTRDKNKIRATWGYPLSVYTAEAAYFYPFLDAVKKSHRPLMAYGLEMNNGGMQYLNSIAEMYPTHPKLMGDWSRFDKTIPAWLIRDAFKIISEAICWDKVQDVEGKIWPVRAYRSKRRWRKLVNYFIDTPVRLSDGTRYIKHSGVPSGACFTNIVDSIVNAIVMRYLVYEMTEQLPLEDIYLGDDSFMVLPLVIELSKFSQLAEHQFGMKFNADKSAITDDHRRIHFLGYYNQAGYPKKVLDSIIASTVYPERTCKSKFDTITRLVGQGYSTFEPDEATAFFKAAHILREEENLAPETIEQYIKDHPERFKYLLTIGVDPKTISFPPIDEETPTFRTQPAHNRKFYTPVNPYDLNDLYVTGCEIYEQPDIMDVDLKDFFDEHSEEVKLVEDEPFD